MEEINEVVLSEENLEAVSGGASVPAPKGQVLQYNVSLNGILCHYYEIGSGDCLWNLAQYFHTPGGDTTIYNMNKSVLTKGPGMIFPGQRIYIRIR